nr:uncharacterized protein LOC113718353 [Coffea arabica]
MDVGLDEYKNKYKNREKREVQRLSQNLDPELKEWIWERQGLERFQKFSPPKFLGGSDPEVAERWLEAMINIFVVLNYTAERQEFTEKYLPSIVQEKRENDFIILRQGTLSVSEYEIQFTNLSKFAPEFITMEQRRVRRFVHELNVEVQEFLAATQINTFTEILEKTQRIEITRAQVKAFHARKKGASSGYQRREQDDLGMALPKVGRGVGGERISGTFKIVAPREAPIGGGQLRGVSQGDPTSIPHLSCGYCGKTNHTEDNYWPKARKYLWCDSVEHQIATCPLRLNPKQPNLEGNRSKMPTRVYTLNHQSVLNPSKVVEGTIHVFHCLAKILALVRPRN